MSGFVESLESLVDALQPRRDSDVIDRLNYCYTTALLIVASLIIFGWEFCGTNISCWFPAYFTDAWRDYGDEYCFIQNTYFWSLTGGGVPLNLTHAASDINAIPKEIWKREARTIPYYQWVPFFLGFQALSFYVPIVLWRNLNSQHGICTDTILVTANEAISMTKEDRQSNIKRIASFLYHGMFVEGVTAHDRIERTYRTSHLCLIFLAIKILTLVNSITQFFLLAAFLDYHWDFGFQNLLDLSNGLDWRASGHFPRVTLCDFQVRVLGNLHRHTVQCFLLINMFSEKIFIFLWWWYLFLVVVNLLSLIHWILNVAFGADDQILKDYQSQLGESKRDQRWIKNFYTTALHADGLFLLKLIKENTNDVITFSLFRELWREYLEEEGRRWASRLGSKQQTDV